jgi:hypothetical protein
LVLACSTQITGTPRSRNPAVSVLILPTIERETGTSAGLPGSQNVFCMSTTTSAVFFGSRTSNQ